VKLYYAEVLNPRKVCALARHLEAPVTFVHVDLAKGEHRRPAFLALNPNGKVPVLQTDRGSLWESSAILCFLARRAGSPLWPEDEEGQIELLRWLSWDAQHFAPAAGGLYFEHVIRPMFGLGPPDPAAVEAATADFRKYARVLDDHLQGRPYLLGDALSVADFAAAAALPYAEAARIPLGDFPAVARWHARLEELPAWREPFPAAEAAA